MSCLDCNDCNQSPIYPVNTALPGPPGASAFVYVAFATTVNNIGNPNSSSASGFVNNQPGANSAFIAIITTNTPFPGNPPASAFNGYWVPLQGITVSGINLQDDNIAVGGGPFTTLDFRGAGLTGVTVTNAGANEAEVQITTAGFSKTSYADLATAVVGNTLNPGAYYWIVDAGDAEGSYLGAYKPECSTAYYTNMTPATINSYNHTSGIIVRATSTNQFETSAIYLARVPSVTVVNSVFSLGRNYVPGTKVVSYGQVFEAIPLNAFNADIEPADDPTRWAYIVRDNNDYVTEAQSCLFEFTTQAVAPFGKVRARWDNKGNYLKNTNSTGTFNEGLKKIFRWGLSTVHSNQINFYDDSTRRAAADFKRSPNFGIGNSNTNYCNIYNFSRNTVDTKLNPGPSTTGSSTYYGTRFINVSIDSNGEITNNSFNNAVLGKILTNSPGSGAVGSQVRILNNTIENSALYNINIRTFENNTITDNTVIGDVYYKGYDGYSQIATFLGEMNFENIPTNVMQYGGGARSWSIATNSGSVIASAPNTIIDLAQTTFAQITPTADIVLFGAGVQPSNTLSGTIHKVTAVPNPTQFQIAGVYPSGGPGNITVAFFPASIPTSFTVFNNNTIKNSVIRGLNKHTHADQCFFTGNIITYSYFENYEFRTSPPNFTFDNGNAYSSPGNEFGSFTPPFGANTSENYTFARNIITNSNFVGNRIVNSFSENVISGGLFYSNAPTINAPAALGFLGNFRTNSINSEKGSIGISPIQIWSQNIGIRFINNSFKVNSIFSDNSLRRDVFVNAVTLEDNSGSDNAAQFSGNKFEGATYNSSTVGGALGNTCGLSVVTFARNTVCVQNTFEGRQASWESLTIIPRDKVDIKQNMFTPNIINLTTRDFVLTGAGKAPPYNQLGPQFFGASSNPIVNITNVTEGAAVPVQFGSITYQTAPYTFEFVTQFPHMMNADWIGKSVSLLITGFGNNAFNFIGNNGNSPSSPNGQYIQAGVASISGNVATIVDDYTFTCTTVQNNSYYWISSTNTVADGDNITLPLGTRGCPTAASYNPLNDIQSTVSPNYWFTQYQPKPFSYYNSASSSIISHNGFEPQVRIALNNVTIPSSNTPLGGSRKFYVYKDYNAGAPATPLYNFASKTLTLPHFFDVMSNTVVLGTSNAAVTYQIDVIEGMPENVLIRFVTLPGCTVQFNLQPVNASPLLPNRIIDVNNQNNLTIKSYFTTTGVGSASSFAVFDEVILIRRGNYIKVDDRVIHTP